MQSRRRRRDRPRVARIDGLVPDLVVRRRRPRDVGRQRHFAVRVEPVCHRRHAEAEVKEAVGPLDHLGFDTARQLQPAAGFRRMTRPQLEQRGVGAGDALEQQLDAPAGGLGRGHARLDHAGVVEDQEIAWPDERRQVGEREVAAPTALDVQQPAAGALGRRRLGDELVRQVELEIARRQDGACGQVVGHGRGSARTCGRRPAEVRPRRLESAPWRAVAPGGRERRTPAILPPRAGPRRCDYVTGTTRGSRPSGTVKRAWPECGILSGGHAGGVCLPAPCGVRYRRRSRPTPPRRGATRPFRRTARQAAGQAAWRRVGSLVQFI